MKVENGFLIGCHCPLCGFHPVPLFGWCCEGCGAGGIRMKFEKTEGLRELMTEFTSYLRRLGHVVDMEDWYSSNFDYPDNRETRFVDCYEVTCKFENCKMHFDVTLTDDKEKYFALWKSKTDFQGIATGYAVKGDIRAKMNRNFKGEFVAAKHIARCKRLDILL